MYIYRWVISDRRFYFLIMSNYSQLDCDKEYYFYVNRKVILKLVFFINNTHGKSGQFKQPAKEYMERIIYRFWGKSYIMYNID